MMRAGENMHVCERWGDSRTMRGYYKLRTKLGGHEVTLNDAGSPVRFAADTVLTYGLFHDVI